MTLNSDLQFIHKESVNSMTTAKWQSARLLPHSHWRRSVLYTTAVTIQYTLCILYYTVLVIIYQY